MPDNDINVALLYQDIGALKSQSEDRTRQTTELYTLVREISATMATKKDIDDLRAQITTNENKADDLHDRVGVLESDRRLMKAAAGTAFVAPPAIAAIIEITKALIGKH